MFRSVLLFLVAWILLGLPHAVRGQQGAAFQWATTCYQTATDYAELKASTIDAAGNTYLLLHGDYNGMAFTLGDTTVTTFRNNDGRLVKLNPTGRVQWMKHVSATGSYANATLRTDAAGNVFLLEGIDRVDTLYIDGTAVRQRTLNSLYVLCKWNAAGTLQWVTPASQLVGNTVSYVTDLATDAGGNVYVAGVYYGYSPATFAGQALGPGRQATAFCTKQRPDGTPEWIFQTDSVAGQRYQTRASQLAVDRAGNVYMTGGYTGQFHANAYTSVPDTARAGRSFWLKINAAGQAVAGYAFGNTNLFRTTPLAVAPDCTRQ